MEIKEARKTKYGYNVLIKDEVYNIERAVFFKHGLKRGVTINNSQLKQILKESNLELAKRKSLDYLIRRRTTKEFKTYLKRFDVPTSYINELVNEYTKKGYLNDYLYAEIFISDRSKKYGKNKIKRDLLLKGINETIIDELLSQGISSTLEKQVKVASKNVKAKNYSHAYNKLMQSFVRKGFEINEIKPYLKMYLKDVEFDKEELKKDHEALLKKYKKRYEEQELRQNMIKALERKGYNLKDILKIIGGL